MFRDWIKGQTHRRDDIGDLARIVAAGFEPRVGESKFTWSLYLRAMFPEDPNLIAVFRKAWVLYIRSKKEEKETNNG